jgi:hypothetical protein
VEVNDMRISRLGAIAALVVLAATPAAADFRIFGAYQDTDERDDTAGGGVAVGFPVAEILDIMVRGTYLEKLEDDPLDGVLDDDEEVFIGELETIPIDVGVRWEFTDRETGAQPYVNGGATYWLLDADQGDVDDEIGFFVGLGSTFGNREGVSFYIEGLYRQVEGTVEGAIDEGGDAVDDDFDIDLSGIGANAGIRFGW